MTTPFNTHQLLSCDMCVLRAYRIPDRGYATRKISSIGPNFGYFANASKSWLVTKEDQFSKATAAFADTDVKITKDGRPYLGAAIGSQEYITSYAESKAQGWASSLNHLASIASTQPHAAFPALTHGRSSKWTYLCRTMPGIGRQLRLVDQSLQSELIPALTGRPPPSEVDRKLFALPARLGGLGIGIPSKNSDREFLASTTICKPLIDQILKQSEDYSYEVLADQMTSKASVHKHNREIHLGC